MVGKSYGEIGKIVKVSKSSLSLWLRDIPLTKKQILGLKEKKQRAVERYRESMRLKRESRLRKCYAFQKNRWVPLSKREIYIAGLFMYWGEGNKASSNALSVANTDPAVISFTIYWIKKCLKVSEDQIYLKLHLYADMDIDSETEYWSNILSIGKDRFTRPYIKKSTRMAIDQRGFGHGTCTVSVYKTVIKENILMGIRAISDSVI